MQPANVLKKLFNKEPRISLTFAGGGCKAFFALGVGRELLRAGVKIHTISGTSAGSAMAMALISNVADEVVEHFCEITGKNPSNFHFKKIIKGKSPFPHEQMYRQAVAIHTDFDKIKNTEMRIMLNAMLVPPDLYPPDDDFKRTKLLLSIANAYRKEMNLAKKGIYQPVLHDLARRSRLKEVYFTNDDFLNEKAIEDIILVTSSAPPVVRLQKYYDGNYYLDGGLYDNLPLKDLEPHDLHIAVYYLPMTRRFLRYYERDKNKNIFFVYPDDNLPITTMDYANPIGIHKTYLMGIEAGQNILRLLDIL